MINLDNLGNIEGLNPTLTEPHTQEEWTSTRFWSILVCILKNVQGVCKQSYLEPDGSYKYCMCLMHCSAEAF